MRLPRARAASGECAVDATDGGGARVLTPLSGNSGELLPPFAPVDSLNSGVTRTTPTLTPTTLRNIEETFMAFDGGLVAPPVSHQHQAGFVTPQVAAGSGELQPWLRRAATPTPPSSQEPSPRAVPQQAAGHTRGGRRPKDDEQVSPEEDQRRRVRRERNKQAAARCRRRRMDLTNTLQGETEDLEDERSSLEREIQLLTAQKEELGFLLDAHRPCCKLGRDKENAQSALKRRVIVKQEPLRQPEEAPLRRPEDELARRQDELAARRQDELAAPPLAKQTRPTTLSVAPFAASTNMHKDVAISTPSQGLGLNFDSLMQGGTGLTPISGAALPPLAMPAGSTAALVTPVVGALADGGRRVDMLSPGVKELVSL